MRRFLGSFEIEENRHNWLDGGRYVFDHQMRTNNNWRVVEPILERKKIGQSTRRFEWLKYIKSVTQTPLFGLDTLKKSMKCAQSGVWVLVLKYFFNLNHLSTLPHLSSFQNGLSEHVTIISSHFLNENVRTVERRTWTNVSCDLFITPRLIKGAWFLGLKYFSRSNFLIRFSYLSSFQNGFNDHSAIITSHFMIKNVGTILKFND